MGPGRSSACSASRSIFDTMRREAKGVNSSTYLRSSAHRACVAHRSKQSSTVRLARGMVMLAAPDWGIAAQAQASRPATGMRVVLTGLGVGSNLWFRLWRDRSSWLRWDGLSVPGGCKSGRRVKGHGGAERGLRRPGHG